MESANAASKIARLEFQNPSDTVGEFDLTLGILSQRHMAVDGASHWLGNFREFANSIPSFLAHITLEAAVSAE